MSASDSLARRTSRARRRSTSQARASSSRREPSAATSEWSVYLVRTTSGSLYAGIATDVERRFAEHGAGRGAKFLRGRGALELVYRRKLGSRSLALRVEHRIKRLAKNAKESLVRAAPTRSRLLKSLAVEAREAD